jgi:hypothetical protein
MFYPGIIINLFVPDSSKVIYLCISNKVPSPSRGGLGWGWVLLGGSKLSNPIPLLTSPLKGEEQIQLNVDYDGCFWLLSA